MAQGRAPSIVSEVGGATVATVGCAKARSAVRITGMWHGTTWNHTEEP